MLVLIFTCDHCPVAQMYEKRIKQLTADYRDRGVAVVAINPNDPNAVRYSEMGHTDVGDTLAEMKIRAEYRHFNFPYLSDGATQSVSLKYGPTATPHAFIFDDKRILRYQGRIDSSQREELVTKHEARDAIEALLAGKPVAVQNTPAVGCSTKWSVKKKGAAAEIAESEKAAVSLEPVTLDQLRALRKNGTGKFLLVNFWATWCEPCVAEFPELQRQLAMYRKRPFDVVTVSINTPDERSGVLSFLKEQHAGTRNLLFDFNDPADGHRRLRYRLGRRRTLHGPDQPRGRGPLPRPGRHQPARGAPHHPQVPPRRPLHRHACLLEQRVLIGIGTTTLPGNRTLRGHARCRCIRPERRQTGEIRR